MKLISVTGNSGKGNTIVTNLVLAISAGFALAAALVATGFILVTIAMD